MSGRVELQDLDFVAKPEDGGQTLANALRARLPGLSASQAKDAITSGKVSVGGPVVREVAYRLEPGQRVLLQTRTRRIESGPSAKGFQLSAEQIVHQDSQLVIVNKPSGLSTVPFEGSEDQSLDQLLSRFLGTRGRAAPLHVVHRIDKETSGLLVFARTEAALRHLKAQFRVHSTERVYEAICAGRIESRTIRSRLVQDRGDGRRGSTSHPELGREAITHVRFLAARGPTSRIECRLETGRTHQIRIHLAEAGHPLLGERVYRDLRRDTLPELHQKAPRTLLHARSLGLEHPSTGQRLHFERPPPEDFEHFWEQLRRG